MARPLLMVAGWSLGAAAAGWWLDLSVVQTLALGATSVGLPVAILQETGQLKTPLGATIMLLATLGEFIVILVITGYELLVRFGLAPAALVEVGKLAALFVIATLVIRWSRALVWWYPDRFERLVVHHDAAELGVRVALMLMLAFVIVAAGLGVEQILGAFIAGVLFAFVLREREALERKVAALGNGLFIPIFFVLVGVRFHPGSLSWHRLGEAGLLLVVAGVVKLGPLLFLGHPELGLRQRAAAAALLSAPLTLVVAITAVGERLGLLDAGDQATLLLLALFLSILYPLIFRLLAAGAAVDARTSA
jgi:trk system potassium uptake protein TrkA